jgi:hypothetical protein
VGRCHADAVRGSRVYTPEGEADRQALNEWIRTPGEYDGWSTSTRRSATRSTRRGSLPAYDIGDKLHPNAEGFKAMTLAFDLKELTR